MKGAHILLQALNILNYQEKTVFIGSLEHTPKYKAKLLKVGESLDIDYLGLIKEKDILFEHIEKAKLFIFPSFNEGMSNMLLEVASLKTPLICSDIPENKAVFSDKEVLYFNSGNDKDLAKKIEWANANYQVMLEKAEKAYRKLIEDYQWTDIARKYSEIYGDLLV